MSAMPEITHATLLAGIIVLSLNAYVVLAGADFGGGVWDLLARGERREQQRRLVAEAIGPIWEANHVWLILAIVLLFTCFPPAFARLGIVLHIPLTLMLVGVVLRGSAFVFRSHFTGEHRQERTWGRVFAIASLVTPVLLGMCIGAVASGQAGVARGSFVETYVAPWWNPFAVGVGLMALVLFAFLAATYLILEAENDALREDYRRRALATGILAFPVAMVVLLIAGHRAPLIHAGLVRPGWGLLWHLATGALAAGALASLWFRRYHLARAAAVLQVSLIVWGWAIAQYPWVLPPDLTIAQAAAPPVTLRLTLLGLAGGTVVLVPSLWYLYRVFKSGRTSILPSRQGWQGGPDGQGGRDGPP